MNGVIENTPSKQNLVRVGRIERISRGKRGLPLSELD